MFDYDKQLSFSWNYDKGRGLSPQSMTLRSNKLLPIINEFWIKNCIDVGCGTGRFTVLLNDLLDGTVSGMDVSRNMLLQARAKEELRNVLLLVWSVENIPVIEESFDMAFLSMVFHHIIDKEKAIQELWRILRENGIVVVRNSTYESLQTEKWLDFFPGARTIELQRTVTRVALKDVFEANGFVLHNHTIVSQEGAASPSNYYQKIAQRSLSSLQSLEDQKFEHGLIAFKQYCDSCDQDMVFTEEVDLFVFQKSAY